MAAPTQQVQVSSWRIGTRRHGARLPLPWYGVSVGVLLHLYRWLVLVVAQPSSWITALGALVFGIVLLCALSAAHLALHAPHSWRWRAPALGAFTALGETIASLVLTLAHQERVGRTVATLGDWPQMALNILLTRVLVVSLFALVLAIVFTALQKTTGFRTEK
jgi:hypothetical protein